MFLYIRVHFEGVKSVFQDWDTVRFYFDLQHKRFEMRSYKKKKKKNKIRRKLVHQLYRYNDNL